MEEVNTQIMIKPDSSYNSLTNGQEDEMSETSIENWEEKVEQDTSSSDMTMRELSMGM